MLRLLLRFFTIEWELVVEEHMMGSFHKLEQHKLNIKECNKFLKTFFNRHISENDKFYQTIF